MDKLLDLIEEVKENINSNQYNEIMIVFKMSNKK